MTFYPDGHPALDMPEFNPEPGEVAEFPVEADIFYFMGVRLERASRGWKCPHERVWLGGDAETAVMGCLRVCGEDERRFHSTHADIWDERMSE